jgi:hypothetical protein
MSPTWIKQEGDEERLSDELRRRIEDHVIELYAARRRKEVPSMVLNSLATMVGSATVLLGALWFVGEPLAHKYVDAIVDDKKFTTVDRFNQIEAVDVVPMKSRISSIEEENKNQGQAIAQINIQLSTQREALSEIAVLLTEQRADIKQLLARPSQR